LLDRFDDASKNKDLLLLIWSAVDMVGMLERLIKAFDHH